MSKTEKKVLLQIRRELDVLFPPKVTGALLPMRWNLSWFPGHVRLYALGRDGNWTCQGNANTPYRVNRKSGNTECMSVNAKDCLVAHPRSCQNIRASPPRKLRPLSCGDAHRKVWGMTGYEGAGHWCNTFRNIYLDNARAVLVNTRTHKTLATGAMRGSDFHVKKIYPEMVPLLSRMRKALSQNPGLAPKRKEPV